MEIAILKEFIANEVSEYQTAHHKLCFAIIARIYRRIKQGYRFGAIKVCDGMIVDGNHRYVAYKLAKIDFEIIPATKAHSDLAHSFKEVQVDTEQDWDANNSTIVKFCDDDFLITENHIKFNDK